MKDLLKNTGYAALLIVFVAGVFTAVNWKEDHELQAARWEVMKRLEESAQPGTKATPLDVQIWRDRLAELDERDRARGRWRVN